MAKGGSPKRRRSENADKLSKVRKRYQRAANRFRKGAEGLTDQGKAFLDSIANRLEKQAQTFTMKNLRNKYSDDKINDVVNQIESDSEFALLSTDSESRKEKLGKVLMQDSDIASRVYAGTIEIWRGKSYEARDKAILEFFDADNMFQVLEKLSDLTDEDILAPDEYASERYTKYKDAIREQVATRIALG